MESKYLINAEYTPDKISQVGQNEIFVFGSNLAGRHLGGAARAAVMRFGAIMGQGEGLQGNSYAIPTMQGGVETIRPYVDRFIHFAKTHPEFIFYVTKIGCGIAGFNIEEIAPLFSDAIGIHNIRLPKEFVEAIEQNLALCHTDTITHAYGVTRTFADLIIARNEDSPFTSPEAVLEYLRQYFVRFQETGDEVAFMAVRTFWCIMHEDKVYTDGKLNVEMLRKKIFNFDSYVGDFNEAYALYCKEKICNAVATFNEFRRYTDAQDVIEDLSKTGLTSFSHCGPNEPGYLISPLYAGQGYPLRFFAIFIRDNWKKIAPKGRLDASLLNEYMFDKHERGIRKYGLDAVIRHDYENDGPCHPEVYFPKVIGSGPVYVEEDDRKLVRSCGEGKGPNSIPNYLESEMAMSLLKDDPQYIQVAGYYLPKSDITLPVYGRYQGKIEFADESEKRRFIDNLVRRKSGC